VVSEVAGCLSVQTPVHHHPCLSLCHFHGFVSLPPVKLEEQSAQVGLNISREKTKVMGITHRSLTQPIAVAQGNIEYVERFTYLGSVISRDGDVEADINTRFAKAAAVFRRLDNVWRSSTLSLKIKLDLYTSLIISTAIYASETWKSTARIRQQLDVFHHRNLRKILGITWKDHVTNMEVLSRTGQRRLQDIVAERRLRMAGHIIRMPPGRPANHAMSWTPRGSGRRRGRPTKTWRSTFKEDLVDRGVDWNSVRAVATDRSRWRTLAAHCPDKDRRI